MSKVIPVPVKLTIEIRKLVEPLHLRFFALSFYKNLSYSRKRNRRVLSSKWCDNFHNTNSFIQHSHLSSSCWTCLLLKISLHSKKKLSPDWRRGKQLVTLCGTVEQKGQIFSEVKWNLFDFSEHIVTNWKCTMIWTVKVLDSPISINLMQIS